MFPRIIQAQPNLGPRQYTKLKLLEDHKDFILQRYHEGKKHGEILEALENERNVRVRLHSFKRALEKWGASDKNLTKSRKLFIRNHISKRRQEGKRLPTVKQKRGGRVLTTTEIEGILNAPANIFQDVKESPGGFFFSSPVSVPSVKSTGLEEDENYLQVDDADIDDESTVRGDDADAQLSISDNDTTLVDAANISCDDVENINEGGYPTVLAEIENIYPGHENGIDGDSPETSKPNTPQNSIAELQAIIQEGIKNLSLNEDMDGSETISNVGDRSFANLSASETQLVFEAELESWKEIARSYTEQVDTIVKDTGLSQSTVNAMLHVEIERLTQREPLPYSVYKGILGEPPAASESDLELDEAAQMIYTAFELFFQTPELLLDALPSDYGTLNRIWMTNIPTILERYGSRNFFFPYALCQARNFFSGAMLEFGSKCSAQELQILNSFIDYIVEKAISWFMLIGMGSHSITLTFFAESMQLLESVGHSNTLREVMRKRLLAMCGPEDPKTIFLYSDLASQMLRSKSKNVRKRGELLSYGIMYTIESQPPPSLEDHRSRWSTRGLDRIGEAFEKTGKYLQATQFLGRACRRQQGSSRMQPTIAGSFYRLGISYCKLGNHKESLISFFNSLKIHQTIKTPEHIFLPSFLFEMAKVASERGPQLYISLEPIFRSSVEKLEKSVERKRLLPENHQRIWNEWTKMWLRGEVETGGIIYHAEMLPSQLSAPSPPDRLFLSGLGDWPYSQEFWLNSVETEEWLGRVEEVEEDVETQIRDKIMELEEVADATAEVDKGPNQCSS
ncbi:hypothetical protein TWF694_002747 [Orbilia ellipsospora]|uniref:Clr5 domain-containing protein n=1 Tax=Orbilia ellipsospora TaxID=2528407 RepID=A0AAV9X5K9_9PEZI